MNPFGHRCCAFSTASETEDVGEKGKPKEGNSGELEGGKEEG
jgi:hypothetical protein